MNIACSTCHHPAFGTSDSLSLGIGEGGEGLGPNRTVGYGENAIKKRIPRNASGLWNLGAKEFRTLFHDGRLSFSDLYDSGFDSVAEEWLPSGFNSILAAQATFPLVSQFEMAGNPKENEVAGALHDRIDAGWPILAKRVRVTGDYGKRFVDAFGKIKKPEDVTIVDISNALAAFIGSEWQSIDSPYDSYLAGDQFALSKSALNGLNLFYGKAGCSKCHSGALLTDHKFHAIGLPPFGPGRTRRFDPAVRDVGFMAESDNLDDAYRFRTPSLKNIALTAPYGHNGAYPTLKGIVKHHLNPKLSLAKWTQDMAALPNAPHLSNIDFVVWDDRFEMARFSRALDIAPQNLSDQQVNDILSFLSSLTGKTAKNGNLGVPEQVPSGLPVDRIE